jgi:hypothetical protein
MAEETETQSLAPPWLPQHQRRRLDVDRSGKADQTWHTGQAGF